MIASILREKGNSVTSVAADTHIAAIVETLMTKRIGAVLVMEGESILGVVSERDIVRALATYGAESLHRLAREVMTSPVVTISPAESLSQAMLLMTGRRVRHLPVIDSGRLVGLVSIGDLVKRRIDEAEREADALKDYISNA